MKANASKHKAMSCGRMERRGDDLTDPESRILKVSDGFIQVYNAPLAVDVLEDVEDLRDPAVERIGE